MTVKHIVVCDRCGINAKMKESSWSNRYVSPGLWRSYEGKDFCRSCWKLIEQAMKKVIGT